MIIPYDVDKAEQILADGGWSDTDGDGIVEKDGQKAEFTVYYSSVRFRAAGTHGRVLQPDESGWN